MILFYLLLIIIPQIDVSVRSIPCSNPSDTFTTSFIVAAVIQFIPIYFIYNYSVNDVFNVKRELQLTFVVIMLQIIIGGILLQLFNDFWTKSTAAAIFSFQLFHSLLIILFGYPIYKSLSRRTINTNIQAFVSTFDSSHQTKTMIKPIASEGNPESKVSGAKRIFEEIFIDRSLRDNFYEHLKKEFSLENLLFVEELNKLIADNDPLAMLQGFNRLYHKYIKSDSTLCINISDQNKTPIDDIFGRFTDFEPIPEALSVDITQYLRLFKNAQREIINLMSSDSWARFINKA
jgi:hypothetical protein